MKKETTITLSDGIERQFQFTFGLLRRLGKLPGDSLKDVQVWDLIWAGLSKKDRQELSVEDVADLIPVDQEFMADLTKKIASCFPKADPNPLPAQPSN